MVIKIFLYVYCIVRKLKNGHAGGHYDCFSFQLLFFSNCFNKSLNFNNLIKRNAITTSIILISLNEQEINISIIST